MPDERMIRWIDKFNRLSPEAMADELLRVEKEFYLPARARRLSYCPDMSRVPTNSLGRLDSHLDRPKWDYGIVGSPGVTDDVYAGMAQCAELSEKARALIEFIREKFGKRCARAAIAVMQGCYTGAEVGANMGVTRQTADGHLAKIRSKVVQRKAIELGLVTRESFIKAVTKKRKAKSKRKVVSRRKPKAKRSPPRKIKASRRSSPRVRNRQTAA